MAKKAKANGRKAKKAEPALAEGAVSALAAVQEKGRLKAPSADQVLKLSRKLTTLDENRQALSEVGRESIAKAKETQHLDALALTIARRLDKLPDEKLAITLPHLLRYIDDLGIGARANQQAEMFVDDEHADLAAIGDNTGTGRLRIVDEAGEREIA